MNVPNIKDVKCAPKCSEFCSMVIDCKTILLNGILI